MIQLTEAMTSQEVQDQQNQHYDVDSKIMQMLKHMTVDQKKKVLEQCNGMASSNMGGM